MLELLAFRAKDFRSWAELDYALQPGLTLVCGDNGAGKSSLQMVAETALTGNPAGLTKDEVTREGARRGFSVELDFTYNGKPCSISRGGGKINLVIDGQQTSVREANFLDQLKLTAGFTFLSAHQAMFVDLPGHKRKELLHALIPQVGFLRKDCTPYAKDLVTRLSNKRLDVIHKFDSLEILLNEATINFDDAKTLHAAEKNRLAAIKAQADLELPMTVAAYEAALREIERLAQELEDGRVRAHKMQTWLDQARQHNSSVERVRNALSRAQQELAAAERERASVADMLAATVQPATCSDCGAPVVCGSCGKQFTANAGAQRTGERKLAELDERRRQHQAEIDRLQGEAAGKLDAYPQDRVDHTDMALRELRREREAAQGRLDHLREEVSRYQSIKGRIDGFLQVGADESRLRELEEQMRRIFMKIQQIKRAQERKKRTLSAIDALLVYLRVGANIMYEIMPSAYYSAFLARLTKFCNYLLGAISNLTLEFAVSEDAIEIIVNNKKYKQLSSGQRQRVRIATTLAFALLAPMSDTLFIDEVFDTALDANGLAALNKLMNENIRSFYKKIVLISHNPALALGVGADRVVQTWLDQHGVSHMKTIEGAAYALAATAHAPAA